MNDCYIICFEDSELAHFKWFIKIISILQLCARKPQRFEYIYIEQYD